MPNKLPPILSAMTLMTVMTPIVPIRSMISSTPLAAAACILVSLPLSQSSLTPHSSSATSSWQTANEQEKQKDPESAAACGECHKAIYKEWKGHGHSRAWTSPTYQAAIKKKKRPRVCHACHIPDRVLQRPGRKPKKRRKLLDEGVTCVSCHEYEGKIHGPFDGETDAHETSKNQHFETNGAVELCSSCHGTKIGPVLPLAKDFAKAGLTALGKSCVGCHMPKVERPLATDKNTGKPLGEKRKGRKHGIRGPSDPRFCAKAFEIKASRDGEKLAVSIHNKAGHRVPGLRIRSFHLRLRQLTGDGKELAQHELVLDHENCLAVMETRQLSFDLAPEAAKVEVVLDHFFLGKKVAEIINETKKL